MTNATVRKRKYLFGGGLQFQKFSAFPSWRDMAANRQADMVMEKELRVPHFHLQATGCNCAPHWV